MTGDTQRRQRDSVLVEAWLDARAADEETLAGLVDTITADAAAAGSPRPHLGGRRGRIPLARSALPGWSAPAHPAGTGRGRRRPGAADRRRPRRRRTLDRRSDRNAVRPQSDRGVALPEEYAEIADCHQGARALAAVMKDWVA